MYSTSPQPVAHPLSHLEFLNRRTQRTERMKDDLTVLAGLTALLGITTDVWAGKQPRGRPGGRGSQ